MQEVSNNTGLPVIIKIITLFILKIITPFRIHLMAGTVSNKNAENEHLKTYIANLKKASDVLSSNNLTGVIEPINGYVIPGYFLNSYIKGKLF